MPKAKIHLLNELSLPACGISSGTYRYGTILKIMSLQVSDKFSEVTCHNCLRIKTFESSTYFLNYRRENRQKIIDYSRNYRIGLGLMTREEEYKCFLSGWRANRDKIISEIESYSSDWLLNGPSKATAEAILKKIRAISEPKSEDDLNIEENKDG